MKIRKARNRLRVLRAECGVSQLDLAIAIGMSRDRYWRYENGYDTPSPAEQARLAKALKVAVADLGFQPEAMAS